VFASLAEALPGLTEIHPGKYGTGPQKGAEAARQQAWPQYWIDRSYFQLKGTKGERLYENLPHQYQALLNSENIYDVVRDPENLKEAIPAELTDPAGRFTALEKLVKDNGYDGLYTPHGVVEVFKGTPAEPVMRQDALRSREKPKTEPETKYKFGSSQVNLPEGSPAHGAIKSMQDTIPKEDLAGDGKDIDSVEREWYSK
jgi:hypothetical protein